MTFITIFLHDNICVIYRGTVPMSCSVQRTSLAEGKSIREEDAAALKEETGHPEGRQGEEPGGEREGRRGEEGEEGRGQAAWGAPEPEGAKRSKGDGELGCLQGKCETL